jgi:hypothetical protein
MVDASALRDIAEASPIEGYALPKMYRKVGRCLFTAIWQPAALAAAALAVWCRPRYGPVVCRRAVAIGQPPHLSHTPTPPLTLSAHSLAGVLFDQRRHPQPGSAGALSQGPQEQGAAGARLLQVVLPQCRQRVLGCAVRCMRCGRRSLQLTTAMSVEPTNAWRACPSKTCRGGMRGGGPPGPGGAGATPAGGF